MPKHAHILAVGGRIAAKAHQVLVQGSPSLRTSAVSLSYRCQAPRHHRHRPSGAWPSRTAGLLDLAVMPLHHRVVWASDTVCGYSNSHFWAVISWDIHQHRARDDQSWQIKAFLIVSAMSRTRTRTLCFTHGRVIPDHPLLLEGILADGATRHLTGDHHQRDRVAVCGAIPVTRVVAPGPDVTSATPTLSVERA